VLRLIIINSGHSGYFSLASRHTLAGFWSQAGGVIRAAPGGEWWAETPRDDWPLESPEVIAEIESISDELVGDRRQELVIIGQDLDRVFVEKELDACLLTDEEIVAGKAAWEHLADPFEPWLMDEAATESEQK